MSPAKLVAVLAPLLGLTAILAGAGLLVAIFILHRLMRSGNVAGARGFRAVVACASVALLALLGMTTTRVPAIAAHLDGVVTAPDAMQRSGWLFLGGGVLLLIALLGVFGFGAYTVWQVIARSGAKTPPPAI